MQVREDGSITLLRPSNFHAHFRRDAMMRAVTKHILHHVHYALVMPNTGPIATIEDATAYYNELQQIVEEEGLANVQDLIMTLYLTRETTPDVIENIASSSIVRAVKYYPFENKVPAATTGSGLGPPLQEAHETLRAMEANGVPLLGHFETVIDKNGRELPPGEREGYMVDHTLDWLRDTYPGLRICFEHISTKKGVEWVKQDRSGNTAATVTPQHSIYIAPDFEHAGTDLKCMPIVKTPEDRAAILEFITSGDFRAIAGDDTAPHPSKTKHVEFEKAANGCWLPHATALYTMAFEAAGALNENFECFMSLNGPRWWGLSEPSHTITIERVENGIPDPTPVPELDDVIVPLGYGTDFPVHYAVR